MRSALRTATVAAFLLVGMPTMALALPADSGTRASVKQRVESSMVVRGEIAIETDGTVSGVQLHREEKLPAGVAKLVRDNALQWRFDPIMKDGQAVAARAPMNVRVVAKKVDGDQYEIGLRGANFDADYNSDDRSAVTSIAMQPPRYPETAFRSGASGAVYLLVKVARDGTVEDAYAEQVNLTFLSSEADQRRFRELFAKNAVAAAKRWQFRVPTEGEQADAPFWSVRVPVTYTLGDAGRRPQDDYGQWSSYVSGPRERAPWRDETKDAQASPDTLTDGGVYMADTNGPKLRTPLQGS